MKLLILRPEPGASRTAIRAREMGLEPIVAPVFAIRKLDPPAVDPSRFEAVLLTSANGARHAPPGLSGMPCFAVGESTAAAARQAGFADVRTGPSDGAAAAAMIERAGMKRAIHLCGREHLPQDAGIAIERLVVYAAEPLPWDPLEGPLVAAIHSPRAGARFAELTRDRSRIAVAAISAAAAAATGEGWAAKAVAVAPRDEALLELAAKLCNHGVDVVRSGDGL